LIPRAQVTAWRSHAPWPTDAQVEQDLVLSYDVAEAGALIGRRLIAKLQGDPWRGAEG